MLRIRTPNAAGHRKQVSLRGIEGFPALEKDVTKGESAQDACHGLLGSTQIQVGAHQQHQGLAAGNQSPTATVAI